MKIRIKMPRMCAWWHAWSKWRRVGEAVTTVAHVIVDERECRRKCGAVQRRSYDRWA